MTVPLYVVGDIHGQSAMLEQALSRIEADGGQDARIVFLGDYVDRGPDSRGVIDLLANGLADGRNWICLRGNHDRMFSMFMEDYPRNDARLLVGYHWFHERIGGIETLASYGVAVPDGTRIHALHEAARSAIPESHLEFLGQLSNYHQEGELLCVHAGVRPGVSLVEQTEDDLLWIRQEFLNDKTTHPWLVVHGHTHVPRPEHKENRVNLDSGAGYGRPLTAAVFEGRTCWVLTENGRVPLLPQLD